MAPPAKSNASILPAYKTFDDLEEKFCDDEIIIRLIHSWEARNFKKGNLLMGVELLLIDIKYSLIDPARENLLGRRLLFPSLRNMIACLGCIVS